MVTPERQRKIDALIRNRQEGLVILEDIYDPHNAAAVLRSCDAFGFHKVWFVFERQKPFNPRRVGKSSSSSANRWLDFRLFRSTEECLNEAKAEGYIICATLLDDTAASLFEASFDETKTALLLGNEHRGLSETAARMADRKIIIPMAGMVQSLNLSVTAAICLYEITRQRHRKGMAHYRLSEGEQAGFIHQLLEKER